MEIASVVTNEPVYFEWADYGKAKAWDKLVFIHGLYVERYGMPPTLCMLSLEDHQDITAKMSTAEWSYHGVQLLSRRYVPRGVFRFALPESLWKPSGHSSRSSGPATTSPSDD